MAGPTFHVAGPSVRPSFGPPASFIQGLQDILKRPGERRVAQEAVDATRLFRDQTLAQGDRKQDFLEAAPGRTEALRVAALARENSKANTIKNLAEGAQFAGGDRFTGFESELSKDPRYAGLSESGKLAARNEFINKNPSALTAPKRFSEILRAGLLQSGEFTGAEIDAALTKEVGRRYTAADKELIKAQLVKPKDLLATGSGNTLNVGTDGKIFSGGGSFSTINDPTKPAVIKQVIDDVATERGLPDNPFHLFGTRVDFEGAIPGTSTDITRQDLGDIAGVIQRSGKVASPTAMRAAMLAAMTGEGNLKRGFDWRTETGKAKLIAEAVKAQASEERLLNRKGGDISAAGQAAGAKIFSPADAATAAFEHNQKLLSRLTPQSLSDEDVITSFLNRLGPAPGAPNTSPTGGNQGGGSVTPAVAAEIAAAEAATADTPSSLAEIAGESDTPLPIVPGADPGTGDRLFVNNTGEIGPLQAGGDAQQRFQIFGNALHDQSPTFQQLQTQARVSEIERTLANMPPSIAQTLAQKNEVKKLEKELVSETGKIFAPADTADPEPENTEFAEAKAREAQEIADDDQAAQINARIQTMGEAERKILIAKGKKALKDGTITSSDLAGLRGNHDDKLIELMIRTQ